MVSNKIQIQITKQMHILNNNVAQLLAKNLAQRNSHSITTESISAQVDIETPPPPKIDIDTYFIELNSNSTTITPNKNFCSKNKVVEKSSTRLKEVEEKLDRLQKLSKERSKYLKDTTAKENK